MKGFVLFLYQIVPPLKFCCLPPPQPPSAVIEESWGTGKIISPFVIQIWNFLILNDCISLCTLFLPPIKLLFVPLSFLPKIAPLQKKKKVSYHPRQCSKINFFQLNTLFSDCMVPPLKFFKPPPPYFLKLCLLERIGDMVLLISKRINLDFFPQKCFCFFYTSLQHKKILVHPLISMQKWKTEKIVITLIGEMTLFLGRGAILGGKLKSENDFCWWYKRVQKKYKPIQPKIPNLCIWEATIPRPLLNFS